MALILPSPQALRFQSQSRRLGTRQAIIGCPKTHFLCFVTRHKAVYCGQNGHLNPGTFLFAKTRCKFEQCEQMKTKFKNQFGDALYCRVVGQNFDFLKKY